MAVINLRGVPDNLAAQLKSEAALAGVGYHEYCVVILSNRGSMGLTLAKVEESRKKIADISVGGGATEGGGDPCLPRGGKAQDGREFTPDTEIGITTGELGALGGKIFGAAIRRGDKVIPAEDGADYLVSSRSSLPDGVPCSHPGCLSHLSHPCEGCGRIGGVLDEGCNMMGGGEDGLCSIASGCKGCGQERVLRAKRKEVERVNNISVPPKLEAMKSLCVRLAGELQDWQNSMALSDGWEAAAVDKEFAEFFHAAGIKLEREILRRWGLEKKANGIKGSGEAGQDKRTAGGDSHPVAEGDHGAQKPAVGVGKPGVDMKALRDICEGKGIRPAPLSVKPVEVDLCGFKSYNETDGEWHVCAKEKHGVKVNHGEWLKI